jgi:SpoIID/LytB domain protein
MMMMSFNNYDDAIRYTQELNAKGYPAKVEVVGGLVRINGQVINDSRKYRVIVGDFKNENECYSFLNNALGETGGRVLKKVITPVQGRVEFYDAEYDYSGMVNCGFRLIPENNDCSVLIHNVKVGSGFHWEGSEDRIYPGIIEIRLDGDGWLKCINEVTIDQYLKGVVPAEMPTNYPFEALKAQAVAARSEVLSRLGTRHLEDDYDLCAGVHCQVYSGLSNRVQISDEAVSSTMGQVLISQGRVCDAVYSSVCGGHTENKENVWNTDAEMYLRGLFDGRNDNSLDLSKEANFEQWIASNPDVYCNITLHNSPPELNGSTKYFRWEETYTRQELEEIIRQKTGVDIGTFFGFEPLKRGVSGRLVEIEILGSRTNLKIKNELNIRRSLSRTHLKSSSFYITMTYDDDSVPQEITFHGAGWGHGVGMCQVGAAVMAHMGCDYRQILKHYYPGTDLKQVYVIDFRQPWPQKTMP